MARKPAGRRTGPGDLARSSLRDALAVSSEATSHRQSLSQPHSVLGAGSGARMSRRLGKTGPQHWLERRSSDAAKEIAGAPAGLA
jgi:hypothetical protein